MSAAVNDVGFVPISDAFTNESGVKRTAPRSACDPAVIEYNLRAEREKSDHVFALVA